MRKKLGKKIGKREPEFTSGKTGEKLLTPSKKSTPFAGVR
jgi:hypothetical protein